MQPSPEPYWKLRSRGGFRGHLLPHHPGEDPRVRRDDVATGRQRGFPPETSAYTSSRSSRAPAVTASSTSTTIPPTRLQRKWPGNLAAAAADGLEAPGAFFSRPYGAGRMWPTGAAPTPPRCRRRSRTSSIPTGYSIPASCASGRPRTEVDLWPGKTSNMTCSAAPAARTANGYPGASWRDIDYMQGCPSAARYNFHAYSAGGKYNISYSLLQGGSRSTTPFWMSSTSA